ncbi:MAG: hypothetical protein IJ682_04360 [Lachnospiraceae bacterium]|nr:hypothetical protein [Lachnospiraceae bacterium]
MDEYSKLSKVFHLLCDDKSRDIFISKLNFSVSGDFRCIMDIVGKYALDNSSPKDVVEKFVRSIPTDKPLFLYGAGGTSSKWFWLWIKYHESNFAGFCDKVIFCPRDKLNIMMSSILIEVLLNSLTKKCF